MTKPTKVVLVNASPKGDFSLTLQYARYLLGQEPDVEWSVAQVGEKLTGMEYDRAWLDEIIAAIERCDAVIWATPVYTMLVPWQLIRFFDLVRKAGKNAVFSGKYATSVMSCFHYYDHLAEEWLRGTCEDLGMSFVEGLSVDNTDLLKPAFRAGMRFFMREFHAACSARTPVVRQSRVEMAGDGRRVRSAVWRRSNWIWRRSAQENGSSPACGSASHNGWWAARRSGTRRSRAR